MVPAGVSDVAVELGLRFIGEQIAVHHAAALRHADGDQIGDVFGFERATIPPFTLAMQSTKVVAIPRLFVAFVKKGCVGGEMPLLRMTAMPTERTVHRYRVAGKLDMREWART